MALLNSIQSEMGSNPFSTGQTTQHHVQSYVHYASDSRNVLPDLVLGYPSSASQQQTVPELWVHLPQDTPPPTLVLDSNPHHYSRTTFCFSLRLCPGDFPRQTRKV
jgi:hypothetical protein